MTPDWRANSASGPPANKITIASNPCIIAQITLWIFGELFFPPDVMVSITKDPESEEVTKKSTNINKANKLKKVGNIKLSNI